jgi:hypothetical protein
VIFFHNTPALLNVMTVMSLYSMLCIAQEITIQMMKKQHRDEAAIIFFTPNICLVYIER